MQISKEKIVKISKNILSNLNFNVDDFEINSQIDESNTLWFNYVSKGKDFWKFNNSLQVKLEGHDYYAVYFAPVDKNQLGGDIWLFIDKKNLKLITYIIGK